MQTDTRAALTMSAQTGALPPPADAEACCSAGQSAVMSLDRAVCLADVFKALADPTRVRLVGYVASVPGGTVCACHLPEELGISQPTLSHHLKKLVDAGVLAREQRGRWAHYTVRPEGPAAVQAFVAHSAGPSACC